MKAVVAVALAALIAPALVVSTTAPAEAGSPTMYPSTVTVVDGPSAGDHLELIAEPNDEFTVDYVVENVQHLTRHMHIDTVRCSAPFEIPAHSTRTYRCEDAVDQDGSHAWTLAHTIDTYDGTVYTLDPQITVVPPDNRISVVESGNGPLVEETGAGSTGEYQYTVANVGNVPVDLAINDEDTSCSSTSPLTATTLEPGDTAAASCEFTAANVDEVTFAVDHTYDLPYVTNRGPETATTSQTLPVEVIDPALAIDSPELVGTVDDSMTAAFTLDNVGNVTLDYTLPASCAPPTGGIDAGEQQLIDCEFVVAEGQAQYVFDLTTTYDVSGEKTGPTYELVAKVVSPARPPATPAPNPTPDPDPAPPTFSDVPDGGTHTAAIGRLTEAGIIAGSTNTSFAPQASSSRAHMAQFAVRLLQVLDDGVVTDDLDPAAAMAELVEHGILLGDRNGHLQPQQNLTRGQAASILARLIAERDPEVLGTSADGSAHGLDDITGSAHEDAITQLHGAGVVAGYADSTFRTHEQVRRDQLATLIARTWELLED